VSADDRADAIVVGGGIIGAACAYYLSRANLSVLVLEANFPGGGVTAAGMGHIVVMDDSEAQLALTARSRRLWQDLAGDLDTSCEDDPCGTIWVAVDEAEMAAARQKEKAYRAHGIAAEILDASSLAAAEPHLRPDLPGGLLVPNDRVLYPPNAARWLLDRARDAGARVRSHAEVLELAARAVRVSSGRLTAHAVINAAGPRAAHLTPGLPVAPRKGHLVITDRYPGFCRHQLVELGYLKSAHGMAGPSVAFNLQPRITGQMLLGSSRQFVGWDESIDLGIVAAMIRRAFEFMPDLASLSAIRCWTGLRPATPDKLPLIGRWRTPDNDGPFVAAGHEGLGITTALATGEMIAALVAEGEPPLDPAPYCPSRPIPETVH
jgi:D-hydroxyproline dehydrogenase subunit beta